MAKANVLIVEDDRIVAKDIRNSLKNLGFGITAVVDSGEKSLSEIKVRSPDLVLMDIVLKGEMSGIEAASQIRSQFNIPVVYLTAYADEKILERAKITEPFGYIIKPFEDYVGNGEGILVVDDEEDQREIACMLLTKLGYTADAVASGEEAVEYLKEHPVDLIVLDMIMFPGMNGRETYEKVIEIYPKQKVIIASGFAETEDVKAAQKLGAGQYLKKPYTLEKLGLVIKEELEK